MLNFCLGKISGGGDGKYSDTSNNGYSENWTTSHSRTDKFHVPPSPIALSIEILHFEPPRSGHLSTLDNGQPVCPQTTVIYTKNFREQTEAKIARTK